MKVLDCLCFELSAIWRNLKLPLKGRQGRAPSAVASAARSSTYFLRFSISPICSASQNARDFSVAESAVLQLQDT